MTADLSATAARFIALGEAAAPAIRGVAATMSVTGSTFRQHAEERMREQQAAMRLAGVLRSPEDVKPIFAEVERRAQMFGRRPAIESVYDDVIKGRWR